MQNHCRQIKALTLHLLPNLRSREERDRKVAIIIFTEVGAWGAPQGQPAPHLQLNPPGPPLTNRFLTPCLPTPSSLGPTVRGSWLGLHVSGPSPPASWGTVFYSPSPDVMGSCPWNSEAERAMAGTRQALGVSGPGAESWAVAGQSGGLCHFRNEQSLVQHHTPTCSDIWLSLRDWVSRRPMSQAVLSMLFPASLCGLRQGPFPSGPVSPAMHWRTEAAWRWVSNTH